MPIITLIGRKQRKMRVFIAALYIILSLGAVTMVYPFLLMVSTSFTSSVDQEDQRVIPKYFYSDEMLYKKYIETKYNENTDKFNTWYGQSLIAFKDIRKPKNVNSQFVDDWRDFKRTLPNNYVMVAHIVGKMSVMSGESLRAYRSLLSKKFDGSLDKLNAAYEETNEQWTKVPLPIDDWTMRNYLPDKSTRKYSDFTKFKASLPSRDIISVPAEGLYQTFLKVRFTLIDKVNEAIGGKYKDLTEIRLSARVPSGKAAEEWNDFVRKECPVQFIRLDASTSPGYRQLLKKRYGTIQAYNEVYKKNESSFDTIVVPEKQPEVGIPSVEWVEYLESTAPTTSIWLDTPELRFKDYLEKKYGTVQAMNRKIGTSFASFESVAPPYRQNDWLELMQDRRHIRTEFVIRNYREVLQYIALHGRSLLNTAILCIALVGTALFFNPLCAYALSRYNLRSTYKILLFLLATMAFPAEVSAIPSFLMIKQLHLMGTYWAVILPSIANGYSIFLLKGFFDSLPTELYEAAHLDGATEMQMYWKVTLPLSMPIMAVIGLGVFTFAYGSFMWAFLVLQDPKMWTLMVWLFQMSMWAPQFLVYAGLVLAALPTLLVFIFCQNIIMRGIIIPSEK